MANQIKLKSDISICVAVWGESFISNFLRYGLESLLSEKNIPNLARSGNVTFSIYSDRKGISCLRCSENIARLKQFVDIKYFEIKGVQILGNYRSMNDVHRDFIRSNYGADLFFICPDTIFAKDALTKIHEMLNEEQKVICVFTPRLNLETFTCDYENQLEIENTKALSSFKLLEIACKNFHSKTNSMILNNETESGRTSGGFFYQNEDGIVGSQFHYYPICVGSSCKYALPDITIDNDYIGKIISSISEVFVFNNALDCCIVDITSKDDVTDLANGKRTAQYIAEWAFNNTNSLNLDLFQLQYNFSKNGHVHDRTLIEICNSFRSEVLSELEKLEVSANNKTRVNILKKLYTKFTNNTLETLFKKLQRKIFISIFRGLKIKAVIQSDEYL